jgi:hypothetical protein
MLGLVATSTLSLLSGGTKYRKMGPTHRNGTSNVPQKRRGTEQNTEKGLHSPGILVSFSMHLSIFL